MQALSNGEEMGLEQPTLPNRLELLHALPHSGIGIELGVSGGWYSGQILQHTRLSLLYSIDPWPVIEHYLAATKNLSAFGDRSRPLKLPSLVAARLFDIGSLDFVYIDGDHAYEAVAADIGAYWPKLRSGGILAGHDYQLSGDVGRAVDEFAQRESLSLHLTDCDEVYQGQTVRSWWFIK